MLLSRRAPLPHFLLLATALVSQRLGAAPVAVLVSGGNEPTVNHCDFYEDIDRMDHVFKDWVRFRAVADGPGHPESKNSFQCDSNGEALRDASGQKILIHREPQKGVDAAANLTEIQRLVMRKSSIARSTDPLLLYFTDHGDRETENGKTRWNISLWYNEIYDDQMGKWLQDLRKTKPSGNIIMVNDHCFGAGMLQAILKEKLHKKGVCGFAQAGTSEESRTLQSFALKTANFTKDPSKKNATFEELFRFIQQEEKMNSTPISTSDLYILDYFQNHEKPITTSKNSFANPECPVSADPFIKFFGSIADQLNPVLKLRLESAATHLDLFLKRNGLSDKATLADITQKIEKAQSELDRLDREHTEQENLLDRANQAWMNKKMAEQYGPAINTRMNEVVSQLNQLSDEMDVPGLSSQAMNDLNKKLETIRNQEIETAQGKISYDKLEFLKSEFVNSANSNNPEFKNFVTKQGTSDKDGWPSDLLDKMNQNDLNEAQSEKPRRMLRQLEISAKIAASIPYLMKDPEALSDYLSLLDCESTPIHPVSQTASPKAGHP